MFANSFSVLSIHCVARGLGPSFLYKCWPRITRWFPATAQPSSITPRYIPTVIIVLTFRARRSRGQVYSGHGRFFVCLSVLRRISTLSHKPGCKLGES